MIFVIFAQDSLAQRNPFSSPIKKKQVAVPKKILNPKTQSLKKRVVKPEKPRIIGTVSSQNQTWLVKSFKGRIWIESNSVTN